MGERQAIQRVLVADDDIVLLRTLGLALRRTGNVTTVTATTRKTAMELARQHRPQLAIVDLQLGDDSGLDLVRDLRSEVPDIVLVMVTAYGSMEVAVRAIKAGANEVMGKPVTAREILARINGGVADLMIETPSADRALWEHVHRVLADCSGNKSEAARRLRRPRSWLRRFLARVAPT